MPKETAAGAEKSPPKELSIKIPSRLARRVETYANENGTDITGVVIEALDVFLRGQQGR